MAGYSRQRMELERDDELKAKRDKPAAQTAEQASSDLTNVSTAGLTQRQKAVLQAQGTLGNQAVAQQMMGQSAVSTPTGARTEEGDEDVPGAPAGPSPIEPESADNRKPAGGGGSSSSSAATKQPEEDTESRSERAEGSVQRGIFDAIDQAVGSALGWFPPYSQIVADATVIAAVNGAWAATEADATPTQRRERGFWIQYDTATKVFSVTGTDFGPWVGPGGTGSVVLSPKPADAGTLCTVASFHTHTPTRYRTVGRAVGPSSADHAADTADNVVGVVYDYVSPDGSGNIPAGHPLGSAAQLYHSGPNRRS